MEEIFLLTFVSSTEGRRCLQNLSFYGFISKKLPLNPGFQSCLPACTMHKWKLWASYKKHFCSKCCSIYRRIIIWSWFSLTGVRGNENWIENKTRKPSGDHLSIVKYHVMARWNLWCLVWSPVSSQQIVPVAFAGELDCSLPLWSSFLHEGNFFPWLSWFPGW